MEWISVKDRLPDKDTKVLCFYDDYMDVMEYWYDDDNGTPVFYNPPCPPKNVKFWMPLPPKPDQP